MMFVARKCASAECMNQVAWNAPPDALCGECTIRISNAMEQEKARWALYANEGLRAIEQYLARWAAFEAIYGPN